MHAVRASSVIAAHIRDAIRSGAFTPGDAVPPERRLAAFLGISRGTVARAFEALRGEGYLESLVGSGTWTRVPELSMRRGSAKRGDAPDNAVIDDLIDGGAEPIDLGVSTPDVPCTLAPRLRAAFGHAATILAQPASFPVLGLPELRRAVTRSFHEYGGAVDQRHVVITSGAQEGIDIVAEALVGPRDAVLCETPTFPGALESFRNRGARLVPLDITAPFDSVALARIVGSIVRH